MERDSNGFIQTYTGRKFWPLDPNEDEVFIEDIAHALSQVCRWTGHCKDFYSVAQHCVIASHNVPEEIALTALLHDASEAYLSDISRPVKHSTQLEGYREAEHKLEAVLAKKFGITFPYPKEVKEVDNKMLYTERRDLLQGSVEWSMMDKSNVLGFEGGDKERQPFDFRIVPLAPKAAETAFLERFEQLSGKRPA